MDKLVIEYGSKLDSLLHNKTSLKNGIQAHLSSLERSHLQNYGVKIPKITFHKNVALDEIEYQLIVLGKMCGTGKIVPASMMAIPPKHNNITLTGIELEAPQLGIPVTWIPKKKTKKAESKGFSLVSPLNVLMQHVSSALVSNMSALFTKQEFLEYIEQLSDTCQHQISDLLSKNINFQSLLSIFQLLLAEKVSIKDSGVILNAIIEGAQSTQNIEIITEHVRGHLARQITASHLSGKGYLPLISLSEDWENEFKKGHTQEASSLSITLEAPVQHAFHDSLGEVLVRANAAGENPVILTRASSRRAVKSLIHKFDEDIPVLSQNEIHADIELKTIGWIS